MPWVEDEKHACDLPAEIRKGAHWYCPECLTIWKTVLTDCGAYDFINDRPYPKIWAYRRTKEKYTW